MTLQRTTPVPGAREARYLFLLILGLSSLIIPVFMLGLVPSISRVAAMALPPLLALGLFLAIKLGRSGEAAAPLILVVPGVLFVVLGASFDIAATLYHTPDLRREANPVARTLLDSGHSLGMVYGFAAVCQGLYILTLSALWIGLLKHRAFLVESLRRERSPLPFLKTATGGGELTWRQWHLPLRASELPDASYVVWFAAVIFLAGAVDRWYLGLEWFGLVPRIRYYVLAVSLLVGPIAYLAWLWLASRGPADSRPAWSSSDGG